MVISLSDPISQLMLLTVARLVVGAAVIFIISSSLTHFRKTIIGILVALMFSNLLCFYILVGLMTP